MADISEPIGRLQAQLDAAATEKSRAFWSRYLKGDAEFRGVPMAGVRKAVHAWWKAEGFGERSLRDRKGVGRALFAERYTEDKLAGVLVHAELLSSELGAADLKAFAGMFRRGEIADWNLCDWFCVKVLGPMILGADDPRTMAEHITGWRRSKPLWQRRASLVAFVNIAPKPPVFDGMSELLIETAEVVVRDEARFAQTAVGWCLRELWKQDPAPVVAFAERNAASMSREGMRYVTEKMTKAEKQRLLDHQTAAKKAS